MPRAGCAYDVRAHLSCGRPDYRSVPSRTALAYHCYEQRSRSRCSRWRQAAPPCIFSASAEHGRPPGRSRSPAVVHSCPQSFNQSSFGPHCFSPKQFRLRTFTITYGLSLSPPHTYGDGNIGKDRFVTFEIPPFKDAAEAAAAMGAVLTAVSAGQITSGEAT